MTSWERRGSSELRIAIIVSANTKIKLNLVQIYL